MPSINISDGVAIIALVFSCISFIHTLDNNKRINKQNEINARASIMPFLDLVLDEKKIEELYLHHQEQSRSGSEKKFKGGLLNHNEMTIKYHTATHLLHKALQIVLGEHAKQKGSNITEERLRFDFSHDQKMTKEQIEEVEKIVNEEIQKGLEVTCIETTFEEAKKNGVTGLFEDRYGDKITVYSIGDFSKEVCRRSTC